VNSLLWTPIHLLHWFFSTLQRCMYWWHWSIRIYFHAGAWRSDNPALSTMRQPLLSFHAE